MTPDFTLSPETRAALAAEIRAPRPGDRDHDADHADVLGRVTVCELAVPTRHGPARVLRVDPPDGAPRRPAYVNFHGGGFVRGLHQRDTAWCAEVALSLGCTVFDHDYRLAPEFPFPVALEEAHDVVAWLTDKAETMGIDRDRIAVGGHSAGGNLATGLCLLAAETGAARPCGQILDYPFLDGVTPMAAKAEPGSTLPLARMEAYNVLYAEQAENLSNPLLSPVLARPEALARLPPALIVIAGRDPLRHEARQYAGQLVQAGVDVAVRQYSDSDHGFTMLKQAQFAPARGAILEWMRARFADVAAKEET